MHDNNGPVAGTVVTIRLEPETAEDSPGVLWTGVTGSDGHARGAPTLPDAITRVSLTAYKPGYRGPYTTESDRAQYGISAPAAWLTVPVQQLSTTSLAFEKE